MKYLHFRYVRMMTSRFTKLFYCERATIAHIQYGDTLIILAGMFCQQPFCHLKFPFLEKSVESPTRTINPSIRGETTINVMCV